MSEPTNRPQTQTVEQSLLGHSTPYSDRYCPEVLFPIARAHNRTHFGHVAAVGQGMDWWHVFELSWLDSHHKPVVAIGRLALPAHSANLIESKSLKLYFNGLNFKNFTDSQALIDCVQNDLSAVAGATVTLSLFDPHQLPINAPIGQCLDQLNPPRHAEQPDASLLQLQANGGWVNDQWLYSDLLRSNCPVTAQPDWATVFIRYQGSAICQPHLLAYLLSFRRHCGFHEQCVEQIFADIWQQLQPQRLMVYAAYTRRGGLDINPCRVSHMDWLPTSLRLARQ